MTAPTPSPLADPAAVERAKERRAAREASGQAYIEGSIFEGMAACVVRHGRTIAQVHDFHDALAIVEALNRPAAQQPRAMPGPSSLSIAEIIDPQAWLKGRFQPNDWKDRQQTALAQADAIAALWIPKP